MLRLLDMLRCIMYKMRSVDFVLIDTYSTRNFWYAYLCSRLCRLLRLKYIPILHGGHLPSRMERSPLASRTILEYSYCNVTPSRYLAEALETKGYATTLIPNTIPINEYPFKSRPVLRPRLLYVRSFSIVYNPQMALHVVKGLLDDYPDIELCMIGPDRDGSFARCKKLAGDLGIEQHVRFAGGLKKEEWHKLSEDYDIFINTANADNMPVSVIEAMALGLPVVSTNPGGIPFIINDGKHGFLVSVGDTDQMVEKIRFTLENPSEATSIAENARRHVEKFGWDQVKQRWRQLLR